MRVKFICQWCLVTCLWISASLAGGNFFPYLYQRTIYTDNLLMPGGWWANPAVISTINAPFAHTANVLPLGDSLLISSFRMFFPIAGVITVGGEILGAGSYRAGSSVSSVSETGMSYSSSFAFKRPRFQIGGAINVPYAGSIGIMGTIGGEQRSTGTYMEGTASPGVGIGWLSPALAGIVSFSAASMFIHHDLDRSFWEKGIKIGLRASAFDTLLTATVEYTASLYRGFGVFTPDESEYDAMKAIVSARLYERLAVSAGFSTDLAYPYSNGPCAHAGLEMKESVEFPFCGGYDFGFRFGQDWVVLHRIWLGLNFKTLMNPPVHAQ